MDQLYFNKKRVRKPTENLVAQSVSYHFFPFLHIFFLVLIPKLPFSKQFYIPEDTHPL